MVDALIIRTPGAMTSPGNAPQHVHPLLKSGAVRRFYAGASPIAVGAPMQTLADLQGSGYGLAAATTGAAPTRQIDGGIHFVKFDGVDDRMDSVSGPALNQPVTVMALGRFHAVAGTAQPLVNLHTSQGGRYVGMSSGGFLAGQFSTTVVSTTPVDFNWHIFTLVANGASSVIGLDNTETTGDMGTSGTATSITIGRNGATGFSQIDLAEVIIWPTALTLAERQAERSNLAAAHGLV